MIKFINKGNVLLNKIKKCNNLKFKDLFKNVLITIIYIIGSRFYFLSLRRINGAKMKCFSRIGLNCYYFLGLLILLSAIMTNISIYLIIFKKFSKKHLVNIFLIYTYLFIIDHSTGIARHGLYNMIVFLTILVPIFFILVYIHFLYFFYKKSFLILIILIIPIPLYYLFFNIYKYYYFSCSNWEKGFNNTIIDNNNNYPCKINIPEPHSCYLNSLGSYTDLTAFFRPTCLTRNLLESDRNFFKNYLKELKYSNESNMNSFGLPITNNEKYDSNKYGTILIRKRRRDFFKDINNNIILMDLYNKNKTKYYPNIDRPEIELLIENNIEKMKIIINIQKNKTLIKERNNKLLINKNKYNYKNIIIFFFDTISRNHFHRKFQKTIQFLKEFSKYEPNSKKKNITIFEYFKYHSLNGYSDPNLKATYYAINKNKKGIHIGNYFSENGFIIGRSNTYCGKECIFNRNKLYEHSHWDHENLSLACLKVLYKGFFSHKLNSLTAKCLLGKQIFEYSLDYLEAFWNSYKKENKMFLLQSLEGHEPTNQVVGHLDDILFKFLKTFHSNGLLKDTAFIIFSDHGEHLNWPLYLMNALDYWYERTLPILILIIPNNNLLFENNLYEIMKKNQQIFITPFDIHDTLIHLAFGNNNNMYKNYKSSYGQSLFKKINYKLRYCQSPFYNHYVKLCNCKKKN